MGRVTQAKRDVLVLSVVAYSVVMGAVMASGKEVMGRIPKGKVSVTRVLF